MTETSKNKTQQHKNIKWAEKHIHIDDMREKNDYFQALHTKKREVCQKRHDIYGSGLKPQKRPT